MNLGWSNTTVQAWVDHVDHNYLLYRSVDYDDCLAQFSSKYVLKEEQRQAVLGLLKQKDVVAVLPKGFGKSLFSSCSRQWNSNEEKRRWNYSYITITKYYQWSSWSNERSWHFSHCITLPLNHEVMRTFCFFLFLNQKLSSSGSLSWKMALIKENPARVLLTWLLQG